MADDEAAIDYDEVFAADPGALWTQLRDDLLDRRARVRLSQRHLLDMLQLPAGTEIKAIVPCLDPPGVDVVIVNRELPVVERESESPVLGGAEVTVHAYNPGDGHTYTRSAVQWSIPPAAEVF